MYLPSPSKHAPTRVEVRELYQASDGDEICNILVSCDGTWQKRGFSSLFGAVFVIAYETGKVLDYIVLSKHCYGCKYWEGRDQSSSEYLEWKAMHTCDANFVGSAGAMEPQGLELFTRSLAHNIRYKYLIADGTARLMPYFSETSHMVQSQSIKYASWIVLATSKNT